MHPLKVLAYATKTNKILLSLRSLKMTMWERHAVMKSLMMASTGITGGLFGVGL